MNDRIEGFQAPPKIANSFTDTSQSIAAHGNYRCFREGPFEVIPLSWISAIVWRVWRRSSFDVW